MKRLTILNICLLLTIVSSFAQTVLETYDVHEDKQTTVILRDSMESDEEILNQLDLDDYAVGEEVYITAEMWAKIQKEQEKIPVVAVVEGVSEEKVLNPVMETEVPKEKVIQEKKEVKAVAKPTKATKAKSSSSQVKAKKKKAKKKKKYRLKKPKRKRSGSGIRGGRMACYRF